MSYLPAISQSGVIQLVDDLDKMSDGGLYLEVFRRIEKRYCPPIGGLGARPQLFGIGCGKRREHRSVGAHYKRREIWFTTLGVSAISLDVKYVKFSPNTVPPGNRDRLAAVHWQSGVKEKIG